MDLGATKLRYEPFLRKLDKFTKDCEGSIIPMFAILAIVLIIVAGAGVDYSRAVNNREKLAHALDAAALTLATQLSTSVMTDAEIDTALRAAFSANLQSMGLKERAISNLQHVVDPDNGIIEITSSVDVPTVFLSLGGIGPEVLHIGVQTEVNYSRFDVELALVLDVTGSMRNDIDALQEASTSLLNTLIPEGTSASDGKVRISIIPYSQGVNLGSYASTVTNGTAGSQNCVTERPGDEKYTDAVYNYDDEQSDFFEGAGDKLYRNDIEQSSSFGESCPDSEVLPLTSNRQKLVDSIDSLIATGGTAGQTGISWGWYTLSPSWSSLWPLDSAPADYDDDDVLKFAIVMTDGDFNDYFEFRDYTTSEWTCSGGGGRRGHSGKNCTYTETTESIWTEYYSDYSSYDGESAVRGRTFCDAIKEENIEIYTIYFNTTGSDFGADEMEYCASSSSNFYSAESEAELINAFGNIAKKIQSIYLAR